MLPWQAHGGEFANFIVPHVARIIRNNLDTVDHFLLLQQITLCLKLFLRNIADHKISSLVWNPKNSGTYGSLFWTCAFHSSHILLFKLTHYYPFIYSCVSQMVSLCTEFCSHPLIYLPHTKYSPKELVVKNTLRYLTSWGSNTIVTNIRFYILIYLPLFKNNEWEESVVNQHN